MEQSTTQSQTMWAVIWPAQAVTENIFFYSDSEATAQCELFLTAANRNIVTYLLYHILTGRER